MLYFLQNQSEITQEDKCLFNFFKNLEFEIFLGVLIHKYW